MDNLPCNTTQRRANLGLHKRRPRNPLPVSLRINRHTLHPPRPRKLLPLRLLLAFSLSLSLLPRATPNHSRNRLHAVQQPVPAIPVAVRLSRRRRSRALVRRRALPTARAGQGACKRVDDGGEGERRPGCVFAYASVVAWGGGVLGEKWV